MYVRRVQSLVARLDLELYLLSFRKRFEPIHGDCREMDEYIFSALLFDEAISFGIIEPFHLSPGHVSRPRHVIRLRAYIESPGFFVKSLIKD